jgi:hypothetical protein
MLWSRVRFPLSVSRLTSQVRPQPVVRFVLSFMPPYGAPRHSIETLCQGVKRCLCQWRIGRGLLGDDMATQPLGEATSFGKDREICSKTMTARRRLVRTGSWKAPCPRVGAAPLRCSGCTWRHCAQGTSNARHVATMAGLEPSQSNTTTSGENGQTVSISDSGMD